MQRYALISILVISIIDQISKQVILVYVFNPPRIIEICPFFNIVPVLNTGVSFGFFSSSSQLGRWLLVIISVIVVLALCIWLIRTSYALIIFGLIIVISGAASNIIDRIIYGAVIDFLDLHIAGFHWPAFNFADSLIVMGVAILLYDGFFISPRKLR